MGWGQDKMQEAFSVGMNRTQTRMREGHTGLQVSSWEVVEVEMGWMEMGDPGRKRRARRCPPGLLSPD